MRAALIDKHLDLINRKCIIFYQANARLMLLMTRQKLLTAWLGNSDIHCIHQTLHLWISIYLSLYKFS